MWPLPRFELVAIDLDGTLLDDDLKISPRTQEVIARVRQQGVHVTIATGRMFASAQPYALQLGLDIPLITYQGALVKTSQGGQVLYHRFVPLELARQVIQTVNEYGYPINVYLDDRLFVEKITPEGEMYARRSNVPLHPAGDLLEFLQEDPIKVLVIQEEDKLQALEEKCRKIFGGKLYITRSQPMYLEFMHPEATKKRGLEAVASHLGIGPEKIMVIGDSYNDLEMFRFAGFSIAMGNARPEIKERADYVTKSNREEGVAEALEKFLLDG